MMTIHCIHIEEPTTIIQKPVQIDPQIKKEILAQVQEEGAVIVHCRYDHEEESAIRIWKTTFLVDKATGTLSVLHHAENISIAPSWTFVAAKKAYRFTLVFSPLPKSCTLFDFFEDISEVNGFFVPNINRNKTDVYHIRIQ